MSISILAADNPLVPTTSEVLILGGLLVLGLLVAALVVGFIIFLIKRPLRAGQPRRAADEPQDQSPAPTR